MSAAKTCQLTMYVPTSSESTAADKTDPLAEVAPATCRPLGLKTRMPAPAGVTGSVKIKVTAGGSV